MPSYLGQNFLKDTSYINFIVQKIEEYCKRYELENIIEIGPGKGALTKKILGLGNPLLLLERDPKMEEYLKENVCPNYSEVKVEIILEDVLEHDPVELLSQYNRSTHETLVAGNLPYYITSPILTQFFGNEAPAFDV